MDCKEGGVMVTETAKIINEKKERMVNFLRLVLCEDAIWGTNYFRTLFFLSKFILQMPFEK